MSFDMTAVGLTLVALLAGVLGVIGYGAWRLLGRRPWLAWVIGTVVVGVVSVPLVEEAVIATRFEQLCRDAGVHVVRKVEVDGFLDATHASSSIGYKDGPYNLPEAVVAFDRDGFRFKEHLLDNGKVRHLERTPEGLWQSIINRPVARYHYKHAYQPTPYETEEPVAWKVLKSETVVLDSESRQVIAREIVIVRYPAVVDAMWMNLLGSDLQMCPDPGKRPSPEFVPEHLPRAALKPMP